MPNTTRPTQYLNWVPDNSPQKMTQPSPSLAATGYTPGESPTAQNFNYILNYFDQMTQYLDQSVNGSVSGLEIGQSMRLLGGGTWSYKLANNTVTWSEPFALSTPSIPDAQNTVAAGSMVIAPGQLAYVVANLPFATTGSTTSGSISVTGLAYELGIKAGQTVTGPGIPQGTSVVAISGTTVTLSQAATATAANVMLTFVANAALSVQVATVSSVVPAPNVIVIATCSPAAVYIGVNASQMRLVDGEQRRLLGAGYAYTAMIQAGQSLAAGTAVYLSPGGEFDSLQGSTTAGSTTVSALTSTATLVPGTVLAGNGIPSNTTIVSVSSNTCVLSAAATATATNVSLQAQRIAGAAYAADTSTFYGLIRGNVVGLVITGVTLSQTAVTSVRLMTGGIYSGFSSLNPGTLYFADPNVPGNLTATRPSSSTYSMSVGVAMSATTLYVQPNAQARLRTSDSVFNDVILQPIAGSSNSVGLKVLDANNNTLVVVDGQGNTATAGTLAVSGSATVQGGFAATGTANVTGATTLQGAVTAQSGLTVTGATSLQGTLTTTGVVQAPSFNSTAGFKAIGPLVYYWGNGQASSSSYVTMAVPVVAMLGTQTASYTSGYYLAPRGGSVTGFSCVFNVVNTQTFVFRININGARFYSVASTTGNYSNAYPKGAMPFSAGQYIAIDVLAAGSPSCVVTANFEVELGA